MDTVRAKSSHPDTPTLTPALSRLADRGLSFDRAISPSPWSLPAHASLFTGLYPSEHNVTQSNRYLSDEIPTLAERLQSAGFTTGVFTPNVFLSSIFNMDRGFDERSFMMEDKYFEEGFSRQGLMMEHDWDSRLEWYALLAERIADGPVLKNIANLIFSRIPNRLIYGRTIHERKDWDDRAVRRARRFISHTAQNDEPFFCTVNLLAAHGPWSYEPELLSSIGVEPDRIADPETWRSVAEVSEQQWPYAAGELTFSEREHTILERLYESWVRRSDRLAESVISCLAEEGVADETLVIVTSDHGEMIAEDGVLGHTVSVHENCVRVPLVLAGPGITHGSVQAPVSLKDVHGTVLSATGIDPAASTLTGDASGSALSETEGIDLDAVSDHVDELNDGVRRFAQPRRALFTDHGWAERRYGTGETLGDERVLSELDELVERITPASTAPSRDVELTDATTDRLERLGYLG